MGDYKYHPSTITGITKSLGQTFYKVEGEGKPLLRSDILLFKENEDAPAQQEEPQPEGGEAEPYMSYRRKRIIHREKNKEIRENKAKLALEAKEAVTKASADGGAAVARVKAKAKDSNTEWEDLAKSLAERARLRRGVPVSTLRVSDQRAQGVNQVGGSSGSGLVR